MQLIGVVLSTERRVMKCFMVLTLENVIVLIVAFAAIKAITTVAKIPAASGKAPVFTHALHASS
jgi:hypothetical protein